MVPTRFPRRRWRTEPDCRGTPRSFYGLTEDAANKARATYILVSRAMPKLYRP